MNFFSIPGFKCLISLLIVLSSSVIHTEAFAQKITVSETPKWVKAHQPDLAFKLSEDKISGGYYYLMVDKQENIGLESAYYRYVIKITNNQGVQSMSDISTEFDPKYQKLFFNKIQIIRNGQCIDKLLTQKIKTVQRETEMDRFSLDGRLTAFVNLTDVRPGDIIDYSVTISGYNPINAGHFFKEFYFEFTLPVHNLYQRLLVPEKYKLNFKYPGEKLSPEVAEVPSGKDYQWAAHDIKSIQYEDDTPVWYDPARRVSISDFTTWKDVVDWILKEYTIDEVEKSRITKSMSGILKSSDVESKITEAIRFVQDDIRYLGLESGLSAYVPNSPSKVLQRRYGDCKDKSLLLCAILQSLGVEAYPVLVNSGSLPDETLIQPSPDNFNHCIVQVFHNNQYSYIDPTLSNQGNISGALYLPEYGEGLVLRKGTEGTTRIASCGDMSTKILSTYNIDSIGGDAGLTIHTTFEGGQADINRVYFASNSLDEISTSYIDFYDGTYPGIKSSGEITYTDDREKNIFTVDETYLIKNFWEKLKENSKKINCSVYAFSLRAALEVPTSSERKMPFRLSYPSHIVEQIEINMPETWPVKPNSMVVNDQAYFFTYKSSGEGNKIRLYYEYKSLSDHVEPAKVGELVKGFNKILDEATGLQITYDTTASKPFNFSWLMGIIAFVVLLVFIFFAVRVYSRYDLPSKSDTLMSSDIGGWLVLVAISLVLSPLRMIYALVVSNTFFDTKTIEIIFNQSTADSYAWSLLVIFELIYNVFILVFGCLVLVLFLKRRTILPRLIIVYYALSFIVNVLDFVFAKQIVSSELDSGSSARLILQSFLVASIWIPYFLYSQRVKRTFVVQIRPGLVNSDNHFNVSYDTKNSMEAVAIPEENNIRLPDSHVQ